MDFTQLPVYQQRETILKGLEDHQVIVVESPTGSGKTTQIPVILHEAGYSSKGMVGITQPRRIATLSVCQFLQRQLHHEDDDMVAYKMRFEDSSSPSTRIKIMTDGTLLQEMKNDPDMRMYSVIMVDEAHERSLTIDFILGLLKQLLTRRSDLKVIISSATLNTQIFSEYFWGCPIVRIATRVFPVDIHYKPLELFPANQESIERGFSRGQGRDPRGPSPRAQRIAQKELLLDSILEIVGDSVKEQRGDILIFLSGVADINECMERLNGAPFANKLHILGLYARLSKEEQELVFPPAPQGKSKVIVATNIAETSVTIDGVTTVIDSGNAKTNFYNPRTYTSSLVEKPISQAAANQRKGRAGRTGPGRVYRLYSEEDFNRRPLFTTEEIYRTDLSEVVLRMSELGIQDFDAFDFISSPGKEGLIGAIETLRLLGALEDDNRLSATGVQMSAFPLLPRHSRSVVEAMNRYPQVLEEVLIATSFLTSPHPFLLPSGEELEARQAHHRFSDPRGDFISYLRLFKAFDDSTNKERFCKKHYLDYETMGEIRNVHGQLADICSEIGFPISSGGAIRDYLCAMARGLIQFVCVRNGRSSYQSLTTERIEIHPGSVLFRETPRFIVAGEIVRTSRTFARSVSTLEKSWLDDISPGLGAKLVGSGSRSEASAKGSKGAKTSKGRENTGSTITLGGQVFTLKPWKGKKKILDLRFEELEPILSQRNFSLPPHLMDIRTNLFFKNRALFSGERLGRVIQGLKMVKPNRDLSETWPTRLNVDPLVDPGAMGTLLQYVLKIVHLKKSHMVYGFLSLRSDFQGRYWLKPSRSIHDALAQTLGSLEALIDDLADGGDGELVPEVKRVYGWVHHGLSSI